MGSKRKTETNSIWKTLEDLRSVFTQQRHGKRTKEKDWCEASPKRIGQLTGETTRQCRYMWWARKVMGKVRERRRKWRKRRGRKGTGNGEKRKKERRRVSLVQRKRRKWTKTRGIE